MKLMIATTIFALTAGTSFAQEADMTLPELTKPQIAFTDAAAIAAKSTQGDLVSMELDYITETAPVYVADLESDTSVARLMIDAGNGEVLVSEVINATSEEAMNAYMENFSNQAEIAEMVALQEMIDDENLSEDELKEMAELFNEAAEDALATDDTK